MTEDLRLRPFTAEDLPAALAIRNRLFPDTPRSLEAAIDWDSRWDTAKFFRERLVAEDGSRRMLGVGVLQHMQWQFHPDKYRFDAEVDPDCQRRGIGRLLYETLMQLACARGATYVRSGVQESKVASLDFLRRRGFEEIQRSWESRLHVAGFDSAAFAAAEPRAFEQGLTITTLADEMAAGDAEDVLRQVYELDCEASQDEPSVEPITAPPFERWRGDVVVAPTKLPEAFFLMKDGPRYVGLSALYRDLALPHVLQQGFTAVARTHRGRGVAMALKVRGARFARERGYAEIRTHNNTRNCPMLRINEAMGFAKQPAEIELGKSL